MTGYHDDFCRQPFILCCDVTISALTVPVCFHFNGNKMLLYTEICFMLSHTGITNLQFLP